VDYSDIQIEKTIAGGTYSVVHSGIYRDEKVAIKVWPLALYHSPKMPN